MGAFLGCLVIAVIIFCCVAYGIEPGLLKTAEELQRIADALEGKIYDDEDESPKQ